MGYRTVVYIADGGASSPARTVSVSQNAPFLGLPVCDLSGQLLSNFRSALLPLNYPGRVKYIMGRPFYEEESAILCFYGCFFSNIFSFHLRKAQMTISNIVVDVCCIGAIMSGSFWVPFPFFSGMHK